MGRYVVVSLVRSEAQFFVRLNSVETSILQLVGFDLVYESDSTAFLSQVENDAPIHLADSHKGLHKLFSAIATQRADCITCKAFRMQSYRNIFLLEDIAVNKGSVLFFVEIVPEGDSLIVTV